MKLSVTIITYNEEKNIERCLKSIRSLADEIIILDSFSTDRTEEIASLYPVKFIRQKFIGYTGQKNMALDLAANDFVLNLDADEMLSDVLIKNIQMEKEKGFLHDAYIMRRCTNFCGHFIKHGTWYPDKKLRLFNKTKGRWVGLNVHEKVEMPHSAIVKQLNGDILHYSYDSLEQVITQNNKYTTIQAEDMFNQGRKAPVYRLIINPLFAFVNGYILKMGFLDGADGFFIAASVAYQTMVKYAKLRKLCRT